MTCVIALKNPDNPGPAYLKILNSIKPADSLHELGYLESHPFALEEIIIQGRVLHWGGGWLRVGRVKLQLKAEETSRRAGGARFGETEHR